MKTEDAARRWADTWQRAWNEHDVESIVGLYAADAIYSSEPFRVRYTGLEGVRSYVSQAFHEEELVRSKFGEPVVGEGRAAVPWWANLVENGAPITLAGTSLLRFNDAGLVIEQWDAWNQAEGHREEHLP